MLHNKTMKLSRNWIDDDSVSTEDILAYVETLDEVHVMNIFEKLESDKQSAEAERDRLLDELKNS